MRKIVRLLFPLLLVISLSFTTIAFVAGEGVLPATHTATIDPEGTSELEISVTTAITPVSKLDVVFLFDVTGSMDWVSDTAKEKAHEITQSIIELVDDTAFGVTYFADYPGSYTYDGYSNTYGSSDELPFVLAQDVTTDYDLISTAIDGLPYQYGNDLPESYTRAIYETQFLKWRSGAKKIVILFGDAPTHDEDFYIDLGENYGGDPGRDGIANTADDLDFETVISQVSNAGITIMPIYCVSYPDDISQLSFDYMAAQTNGEVVNIDDASLILPTIVSMVESQVETINVLTLSVPAEYVDYVSWTPETHGAVGPETTVNFVVTFTNPGTLLETESLEIPITALGDGVVLGSTVATITMVAGVRPPVASFTVDLDVAPVSQSLGFDASDSYDPDGSIASYSWDYGDGETGEGASSVHVYEQPGEYLVILTVVDDSGATDTISLIIEAQVFSATIVDVDYPSEVEKGETFTVEVTVGYEFPILTTTSLGIFDVAKLEFAVEERVELDGAGTEVFTFELTAPDAAMTWELEANVLFLVGDTWLYDEGTSSEAFSVEVVSGAQLPWEWLLELPFEYLIIIALVLLILLILLLKRIF